MPERCPITNDDCKYAGTEFCMMTTHHQYWPKRDYKSAAARAFRELPENKERLSRCDHDELHATTEPPQRPPEWYMEARLRLAQRAIAETLDDPGAA